MQRPAKPLTAVRFRFEPPKFYCYLIQMLLKKIKTDKDLILIGGGHSNLKVIKDFVKKPIPNLRITLISNVIDTPYSGMLPGYIEGLYTWRDVNIDLYKLSTFGNFRFIHDEVININGKERKIFFNQRPHIKFDYLSINIGIESDFSKIQGAKKYTVPLKPISRINYNFFQNKLNVNNIAIIGAGSAGVEISLALRKRVNKNINVTLFSGANGILPSYDKITSQKIKKILINSNIKLIEKDPVRLINKNYIITSKNIKHSIDKSILATNGLAPSWIRNTDLKLCAKGFIETNTNFQTNFDYIFASGDIINFANKDLPKSGVYAVKSGKILSKNIRNKILKKQLLNYIPQNYHLSLIGLANNKALGHKYGLSFVNKFNFDIKKLIDKNFVEKYSLKKISKMKLKKVNNPEMLCKGCAAKISIDVIKNSIPSELSYISNDAALIPTSKNLYHTIDMINSIITDPYKLGMISANHSLSDIYASGSKPVSAQMILQLPLASNEINSRDLNQVFSGAKDILQKNSCELSGGHTMIGEDDHPVIGFSVIGKGNYLQSKKILQNGDLLILTGKIGSGLIFAGINSDKIDSFYQIPVLEQMLEGNFLIGNVIKDIKPICATDITGFGLCNHLLNLINRVESLKGLNIKIKNIPIFDGVIKCINRKVRSSLFLQNYNFGKDYLSYQDSSNSINEILFDPQTVGGIAFIIPKNEKQNTLSVLNKNKIPFSIIGKVDNSQKFLKIS